MSPNSTLWQTILQDLEKLYNEETYNELFLPVTSTFKDQNGLLTMVVANEFLKNRINKLYIAKINELATKYSSTPVRLKFISQEEVIEEPVADRKLTIDYRQGNLNSTYTFDSFVVGKSNMFAFRMAMKVADQPAAVANPFYIFGDVGLGKTHLMQAIGNYILDNDVEKRILYVKADNFIEDFVSLLSRNKNKTEEFNAKYKDIDVILVDDIQIMANASKTQMEFFKLFDYLYLNNKQIVITSDKPASQLTNIMPRLTTRFEAGLSVDIQIPELEHRISILKRKTATLDANLEVGEDILTFIASQFAANIREMEGALIRLISYAQTFNLEITMDVVEEALGAVLKTKKKTNELNENNYDKIQSIVADYFQVSLPDLIGKKRHAKFTLPRHIAMYLIKLKFNIPYKTIGSLFNDRDHSTVLAACEKVERDMRIDSNLKFAVDSIVKKIDSPSLKW